MRSAAAPAGAGRSGAGKSRVCGEDSRFGGRPFLRPGRSAVGRGGVGWAGSRIGAASAPTALRRGRLEASLTRLSAFQAVRQQVSTPRFGDPAGISTLSQACRDGDDSRVSVSATVRMSDRACDDRGWRGPAASVARIVRLAASQGLQHGGRAEGHGGPRESQRLGRSRLHNVVIGQIAGDAQPLRLPWPSALPPC